jgi:hypothetical protein
MWEEEVVIYMKALARHSFKETEENKTNQGSRDLIREFPE